MSALQGLSVDVIGNGEPEIVVCTGAATCKLGLCLSRGLADAIKCKLRQNRRSAQRTDATIRISGCPNSCANHYIADIGFQGAAKRVSGKLMPCYDVLAGARMGEGNARLAERIGTVPAKRIPELLAEAFAGGATGGPQLEELVQRYSDTASARYPQEYFCDYGSSEPFSLAGRGPGECGAGVMDVMKVDIDEAKAAIKAAAGQQRDVSIKKHRL
jgi:sulfite reductase (ferredoxin)